MDLILRMPLHAKDKSPVVPLNGFDDAVRGGGGDAQADANLLHRLMMAGVDLRRLRSHDTTEQRTLFDPDRVDGLTAVLIFYDPVRFDGCEVLEQRAAVMHIQELHPPADCQNRQVAAQSSFDRFPLHAIQLRIGFIRFRVLRFPILRRIDIDAAHYEQAVRIID